MMRINLLKTSPDRAGRYWVTFDDGSKMAFYRQTVEDFGLYSGMELTDDQMAALTKAAGQWSAKMRAVRIVSASSVSQKDLEQRLVHKGEDPRQAKAAVAWMSELNLVDDRQTAEHIVSRCVSKGYGLARAKQMLFEKRIPKDLWNEVLADYPEQIDKITEYLRSRLDDTSDERDRKRAIDALMRRGHSYSHIRQAMNRLMLNTDDFLEE